MSAGGSTASADSRFQRLGTANTTSFRALTPQQTSLFNTGLSASTPGVANAEVDGMLTNRMTTGVDDTPYQPELCQLIRSNLPGVSSAGQESLTAQARIDPTSGSYAENTFDRYATDVGNAMAVARSGPNMTRGGTAASGFAQAQAANDVSLNREDVLTKNRQADASISQGAAGTLASIDQGRDNAALQGVGQSQNNFHELMKTQLSAGGMASERLKMFNDLVPTFSTLGSTLHGTETNNLRGRGAQTSSSMGASLNLCCFIFLESYNGELPWYVRAYRDKHAPECSKRRNGYISMSRWLVPMMRVSWVVTSIVNHLLVKPLTKYGAWKYGLNRHGWLFAPVKGFWFGVWKLIGKES
jgi:hypothetical protein